MRSAPSVVFEAARSGDWWVEGSRETDAAIAYQVHLGSRLLGWDEIARGLRTEPALRDVLRRCLASSEHEAFFWECSHRPAEADRRFSFVLVEAKSLAAVAPSSDAFGAHLRQAEGLVATFPNLGGDAQLVVPTSAGRPDAYAHLAAFVRHAPGDQVDALWVAVGEALRRWHREQRGPVWLSTSGLGVPWVHVRLDSRPKYYVYAPFRAESGRISAAGR